MKQQAKGSHLYLDAGAGGVSQDAASVLDCLLLTAQADMDLMIPAENNSLGTVASAIGAAVNIMDTDGYSVALLTAGGIVSLASGSGDITITGPVTSSGGSISINPGGSICLDYAVATVLGTTGFDILLQKPVALLSDATISSGPGAGNINFSAAIATTTAGVLDLTAGSGSIVLGGQLGSGAQPLGRLILGDAASVSFAADVYAQNGVVCAPGMVDSSWSGTISFPNTDLYLDHAGRTLSLAANLSCRSLYFYRGSLSAPGRTISTGTDFVAFGSAYNPDDPEWTGVDDSRFAYYHAAPLAYYPGGGIYTAATGNFATAVSAAFTDLIGTTLQVGGSFYNNGASMNAGAFALSLPPAVGAAPAFNATAQAIAGQWGAPYAAAFNMTVSDSTATGAIVSASSSAQGVVDASGGFGNPGWQFARPVISWAATVYDDVVRVEFEDGLGNPMPIENSANEISARVAALAGSLADGAVWHNGGAVRFDGAFIDSDCQTSTDSQGDLPAFYLRTVSAWNTDATGASAGAAISTDRDGVSRTAVPDLSFLPGLFRAALGKTMVQAYGSHGEPAYAATLDRCRPVLVSVEAGQAAHSLSPYEAWDAHNYLQLRWSEPVNLGSQPGFTIADPSAANVQAMAGFSSSAEHGGWADGSGTLSVAGYLSVPGALDVRSRDAGSASDVEATALYRAGPNVYASHGLYISVAGWSFAADGTRFWPGYLASATTPSGTPQSVTNPYITDAAGNALEASIDTGSAIPGASGAEQYQSRPKAAISLSGSWDTLPPEIQYNALDGDYDVVPYIISGSETRIERFEIRFSEAVRDSTLTYPTLTADGLETSPAAFEFRSTISPYRYGGSVFSTDIQSVYLGGLTNVRDDHLASVVLTVPELYGDWTSTSQMYFRYSQSTGLLTDLAGNPMATYSDAPEKLCVEKVPPRIRLASAIEGGNRIYVAFTEPIRVGPYPGSQVLDSTNFTLSLADSMGTIQSVAVSSLSVDGWVLDVYFELSGTVTLSDMLDARLALSATIIDKKTNHADTSPRRAVDIGLGVMNVLSASDGIHAEAPGTDPGLGSGSLGLLRDFDGSGRLYDRDVTLFASLDLSPAMDQADLAALPVLMYYDTVAEPSSYALFMIQGKAASETLWLPLYLPGYNTSGNADARAIAPFFAGALPSTARNFLIPSSDPDVQSGAELSFIFTLGDLFLAREGVPGDPRSFDLWSYQIKDVVKQRGGVTILNNVINSLKRERTAVQLDLPEGGQVSVLVFTLDGDVVKALHRGRLGAGTYTFTWDGTNLAGDAVARGIYFVRVVGPGLDEIRKVMVIKE